MRRKGNDSKKKNKMETVDVNLTTTYPSRTALGRRESFKSKAFKVVNLQEYKGVSFEYKGVSSPSRYKEPENLTGYLIARVPGKHIMLYEMISGKISNGEPLTDKKIRFLKETDKSIRFEGLTKAQLSEILRVLGPTTKAITNKMRG